MEIGNYMQDGANHQARAVLCFLQGSLHEEDTEKTTVARWENCREQGYVLSLVHPKRSGQINIAFFEHRNSDEICAIEWEEVTMNSPTIETAKFGDVYKTNHDVSFGVSWGKIKEMSDWIAERLNAFIKSEE